MMRVVARVAVTLTGDHCGPGGWSNRAAERFIWETVAGLPPTGHVRLDVGPVRYPSPELVSLLRDVIGTESTLVVEGSAEHVRSWMRMFQGETETGRAA